LSSEGLPAPHRPVPPVPRTASPMRIGSPMLGPRPAYGRRGSHGLRPVSSNQLIELPSGRRPSNVTVAEGSQPCEACDCGGIATYYCVNCDMTFCDDCWPKQGPHKRGKLGPDGFPHEKSNHRIVTRLRDILTPSADPRVQENLHIGKQPGQRVFKGVLYNTNTTVLHTPILLPPTRGLLLVKENCSNASVPRLRPYRHG